MAKKKAKRQLTAEAVTINSAGRVLLVKQGKKNRGWELPGGHVKKGESLIHAVVREVREEAALDVTAVKLIGVFYIPRQDTHDFVFLCRLADDQAEPQPGVPEIIEARFFASDDLPKSISAFTISRINDALEEIMQPLPLEITGRQWVE